MSPPYPGPFKAIQCLLPISEKSELLTLSLKIFYNAIHIITLILQSSSTPDWPICPALPDLRSLTYLH